MAERSSPSKDAWTPSPIQVLSPDSDPQRNSLDQLDQRASYERSPSSMSGYSVDARSFATFGTSSINSSVEPMSPIGRSVEIRPHLLHQAQDTPVDEVTAVISPSSAYGFNLDRPGGQDEFSRNPPVFSAKEREVLKSSGRDDASEQPSREQKAGHSQFQSDALKPDDTIKSENTSNSVTQIPSLASFAPPDLSRLALTDPPPSPRTLMRVPWNIAADGSYAETIYEPAARALRKQLDLKLEAVKDIQREGSPYIIEIIDREGLDKMFRIRSKTPPPGEAPISIFAFSSPDPRSPVLDPIQALFNPGSPSMSIQFQSNSPGQFFQSPLPAPFSPIAMPIKQHSRSRSESKPSSKPLYPQRSKEKPSIKVRVSKSMQSLGAVFRGFDKDSKSYGASHQNDPSRPVVGLMSGFQPTPSFRRRQSSSNIPNLQDQPVPSFIVSRPATPVLSSSPYPGARMPEQIHSSPYSIGNKLALDTAIPHLRGMRSWESAQSDDTARPDSSRSVVDEGDEDVRRTSDNWLMIRTKNAAPNPMEANISASAPWVNVHQDTPFIDRITRFQAADIYCRTQLFDCLAGDTRLAMTEGKGDDEIDPSEIWNPLAESDPRFALWDEYVPSPNSIVVTNSATPNTYAAHEVHSSNRSESLSALSVSSLGNTSSSRTGQSKPSSSSSRRLVGATLERWIDHLTIHFDREAVYAFLLTYRVLCSPLDLCRLLISRFEWAITPDLEKGIKEIENLKTMARVRTFHVWKLWLMYFFEVDWLGNSEMRVLTADWVNDMRKREDLDQIPSAMTLIKKLKELLKERRGTYNSAAGLSAYQAVLTTHSPAGSIAPSQTLSQHRFSRSETTLGRPAQPTYGPFNTSTSTFFSPSFTAEPSRPVGQSLNRKKSVLKNVGNGTMSGPPPLQAHSIAKLWGSLGKYAKASFGTTFGDSNAGNNSIHLASAALHNKASVLTLPQKGDLLAMEGGLDALFKTFPATDSPPLTDRESLTSISSSSNRSKSSEDDGEEQPFSLSPGPTSRPSLLSPMLDSVMEERVSHEYENELGRVANLPSLRNVSPEPVTSLGFTSFTPPESPSSIRPTSPQMKLATAIGLPVKVDRPVSESSLSIASADESSASSSHPGPSTDSKKAGWTPMFASAMIVDDDFDLSDSDDENYNRTGSSRGPETWGVNLERRSLDSLEEIDPSTNEADIGSLFSSAASIDHKPSTRPSTPKGGRNALGHSLFQYFNPSDVASEDDLASVEKDGVSAALARLEGRYDEEALERIEARKRKDEERIEEAVRSAYLAWKNCLPPAVMASEEMVGDGRYGRVMSDRESLIEFPEKDEELKSSSTVVEAPSEATPSSIAPASSPTTSTRSPKLHSDNHETPRTTPQTPSKRESTDPDRQPLSPGGRNVLRSPHGSVQRLTSFNANSTSPTKLNSTSTKMNLTSPKKPKSSPVGLGLGLKAKSVLSQMEHRSFILDVKTSVLADQFCLIDAGYLNAIGFQELTSQPLPWLEYSLPAKDDWSDLLKEKAIGKADRSRKFSDVDILMQRSGMVIRWVQSEIILTKPSDRPAIVGRFIKLAAQCYNRFNMQSTINILLGLQTPLIKSCTGKKVWSKIGAYERGLYRDLQEFVTPENGWIALRELQEGMISREHNSLEKSLAMFSSLDTKLKTNPVYADPATKKSTKIGSTEQPFFIPYLGIYIQDLEQIAKLPDHLYPYPEPDSTTLSPIPSWLHLTPILNLEKLRARALVTKNICILKTLASNSNITPVAGPFRLCFKLRALPDEFVKIIAREHKA